MIPLVIVLLNAAFGWMYLLCRAINRISEALGRRIRLSIIGYILFFVTPVAFLVLLWWFAPYADGWGALRVRALVRNDPWGALFIFVGVLKVPAELIRQHFRRVNRARALASRVALLGVTRRDCRDVFNGRGTRHARLCRAACHVPGNELGFVDYPDYLVTIEDLPAALAGMQLVQVSDLHFSPHQPVEYFQRIVTDINAWTPDVIMLTGDFCNSASDVPVVAELLAPLRARHGVYFTCGNHDIWHGPDELRRLFGGLGFIDVAGRVVDVAVGDAILRIGGTERPWGEDDLRSPLERLAADAICVVLSHDPDNIGWLKRYPQVKLVVSGHTHGGQIALPGMGPLLVPSLHGSAHAAGFVPYSSLLYVSRGLSISLPLRLHCPAEATRFVLRASGARR